MHVRESATIKLSKWRYTYNAVADINVNIKSNEKCLANRKIYYEEIKTCAQFSKVDVKITVENHYRVIQSATIINRKMHFYHSNSMKWIFWGFNIASFFVFMSFVLYMWFQCRIANLIEGFFLYFVIFLKFVFCEKSTAIRGC